MSTSKVLRIIDLSSPSGVDGLGKKAANLAEVATIPGVLTPKGFAIPGDALDGYLDEYRPEILRLIRTLPPIEAHSEVERMLIARPLDFDGELEVHLARWFPPETLFAVRSSAHPVVRGEQIAEDSKEHSLAGQYSSFLRVPLNKVPEAVSRCAGSLFNARSIELFQPGVDTSYIDSTMTVIIQDMVEASASGVMMTVDPIAFADGVELTGIEASYGACEVIVSGKAQGDLFLIDRAMGTVTEIQLGSKRWLVDLPVYGGRSAEALTPVADQQRGIFALSVGEAEHIANLGLQIEQHFGLPQDIEFVLSSNREVFITQARPITTLKEKKK